MRSGQPGSALRQLRALFAAGTAAARTDGELLARYAARRAESAEAAASAEDAFAALVDRHGPMVWGVCRRVLGDAHEAEDAFQATFLILARKAGSVRVDGSLGRWLYGVAHRVAARARAECRRREGWMERAEPESSDDPAAAAEATEIRAVVGEELDRLPAKYRCPLELCNLLGMTYEEAARQLDWPVATVKSRLARGRDRLRRKLVRRGLAPAAAGAITSVAAEARAAVPAHLAHATARAAAMPGAVALPASITNLSEGVSSMMMWEKLRLVAAVAVVALGLSAHAISRAAPGGEAGVPQPPRAEGPGPAKAGDQPADPRWTRTLPCGATIEIVGVSDCPTGPTTWWRPDGSPCPALCDPADGRIQFDSGTLRAVVARVANVPDGAQNDWSIDQGGSSMRRQAVRGGKRVPGLSEVITVLPSEAAFATARFEVAAGPWKTMQTWGPSPGARGSRDASYVFSAPIPTREGTALSVSHNIQDKSVRLIAIEVGGREVPGKVLSGSGASDFHQLTVEFDLLPARITEFRLQARPFEKVDIAGIALRRR
ncbi:ECF RNA polymerase sigma factor SigW [Aquisphaera giovannonii]|uniref:ECF RNA polymerase sigma factor SigW n=1 Tax=Aquisphaera giovannonii TaxID=406548 RepID=A0A5B9WDA9_9BACT|nr:sigma-70 family RNA polymerase sigma factor [Aquisphaera giovannonii]QEH38219.1 ECF RNA polymerase sigma factor SigW [Aquisphaera giovannonii]